MGSDESRKILDEVSARLEPYRDVLSGTEPEHEKYTEFVTFRFESFISTKDVLAMYKWYKKEQEQIIQSIMQIPPEFLVVDKRKINLEP